MRGVVLLVGLAGCAPAMPAPANEPARDVQAPAELEPEPELEEANDAPAVQSAEIVGAIPAQVIRDVVRAGVGEVRACYGEEVEGVRLQGFRIGPDGSVDEVRVHVPEGANPQSEAAAACMREAVQRWTFPAPEGGGTVVVSYPWMGPDPG